MSFNRFQLPYIFGVNGQGLPYENAYLIFYEVDQVTQQTTYADYLCTVPSTTVSITYNSTMVQAVQANANGAFPTIFFPDNTEYYVVYLDENLSTIKTENHVSIPPISTLNGSQFIAFGGNTYVGRQSIEIVGTTYTPTTTASWGGIITFNNPNPISVTLAAPSLTIFPAGWFAGFQNLGNGQVTITGGANINGSTTLVLNKGDGAEIVSDGAIFNAETGAAELLYFNPGTTLTVTANAITVTNSQHLINTSSTAQSVNTINGTVPGQLLLLKASSITNALTVTNGTNIKLTNGTNWVSQSLNSNLLLCWDSVNNYWIEISRGGSIFISAETAVTTGTIDIAHGLGVVPILYSVVIRCKTAEGGYSVGDEVLIPFNAYPGGAGGATNASSIAVNATNISIVTGTVTIASKASPGAAFSITIANWKFVARIFQ